MSTILQIDQLTKRYGQHRGILDVSFDVQEGEVFGFLGPNGAGKTTTIRMLMGLLRPTSGRASIGGLDCWQHSTEVKKLVGYLPGEFTFDPGLRGAQVLAYLGHLRGGVDQAYVRHLCERLDFDPSRRFREYSRGNKQKLGLVQALMHQPRLLILDEPTSGLDPLNQQEFYTILSEIHAQGRTIFLSSHILPEVERICDRAGMIRAGQLIQVDHVATLKQIQQHEVMISFAQPALPAWFTSVTGVTGVAQQADPRVLHIQVQGQLSEIIRIASEHHAMNMETCEPSLEEIFLRFYEAQPAPALAERR